MDVRGSWQTALLAEGERAVHNMVLSHWENRKNLFFCQWVGCCVLFPSPAPLRFSRAYREDREVPQYPPRRACPVVRTTIGVEGGGLGAAKSSVRAAHVKPLGRRRQQPLPLVKTDGSNGSSRGFGQGADLHGQHLCLSSIWHRLDSIPATGFAI